MSRLSRRGFLAGVAAASLARPRPARAAARGYKLLEIYNFGGTFRWNAIRPPDLAFAAGEAPFDLSESSPDWGVISRGDPWAPASLDPVEAGPFVLGPAASPLLGRADRPGAPRLLDVTRVVPMSHDLNAHEVAEPLVLTGDRPGRATAKGLSAMVNRLVGDGACHSVVLDCAGAVIPRRAACSVGVMGLGFRPHVFPVPPAEVYAMLDRDGLTSLDVVRSAMTAEYGAQLVHPALGTRLRSKGFEAYESAWSDLSAHAELKAALTEAQVAAASLDDGSYARSAPARAVELAIDLLRGTSGVPVQSVTVLEGAMIGSYDTHTNTGDTQDGGLWSILRALAVAHAARPLDDILVYIHSEFGRLDLDGEHTGSEHWCYGYENLLIGGPVRSPGISGAFALSTGGLPVGSDATWSPTDLYGALLWATQPPEARRDVFSEVFADAEETVPLLDATLQGGAGRSAGSPEAVHTALFGEDAG